MKIEISINSKEEPVKDQIRDHMLKSAFRLIAEDLEIAFPEVKVIPIRKQKSSIKFLDIPKGMTIFSANKIRERLSFLMGDFGITFDGVLVKDISDDESFTYSD